jgi:hypothetical protein
MRVGRIFEMVGSLYQFFFKTRVYAVYRQAYMGAPPPPFCHFIRNSPFIGASEARKTSKASEQIRARSERNNLCVHF